MPTLRVRLFKALESFLRVPPLLVVDEIFRISFGIGSGTHKYQHVAEGASQRTTYIPDRNQAEVSDLERLTFENETVTSASIEASNISSLPGTPQQKLPFQPADLPILNDLWQIFCHIFRFVFTPDPSIFSTTHSRSPSSPAIVENEASTKTATVPPVYPQQEFYEASAAQTFFDLIKVMEFFMYMILFFVATFIFILATENLIKLYSHLFSFFALYLSYMFTPFPTELSVSTLPLIFYNIICRCVIAAIYYGCRSWPGGGGCLANIGAGGGNTANDGIGAVASAGGGPRENNNNNNANRLVVLSSVTDFLLLGMFFVTGALRIDPILYVIIMIGLHHPLIKCLPELYQFLVTSLSETKRVQNEYGLSHLLQVESGRLQINMVFRLFWISRALYDIVSKCCNEPVNSMVRYVMTHGTETFTGVVGLTVTVSAICHHIGEFLLYLLYNGTNTEADANRFGSISTVLFFILSLQTGLTSLDPEKRLDRLAKNIVLLGTALFHALHQMIAPVLTAFRAFQTLQIRAAVLSCSAFIGSTFLTVYLIRNATVSTWSLAVLALAIEFKLKICISLLISFVVYLSQLVQYPEVLEKFVNACRKILPSFVVRFFDHLHDELSHEDVVFYLRSVANIGEFLTGIFLFANAVWIFFFESASAIRAIGMSVHAYFNIWCEAQKGWRVYCQRKTASQKIMSLADATEAQLKARQDDVCAVCYEEMESAKVTNCNHLFHAVCLRKWLYVQNTCPLCHEVLYREDALENSDNEANIPPQLPQLRSRASQEGGRNGAAGDNQASSPTARGSGNNNSVNSNSSAGGRIQNAYTDDNGSETDGYAGAPLECAYSDSSGMSERGTMDTAMSSNASSSRASLSGRSAFQGEAGERRHSSSDTTEYAVDIFDTSDDEGSDIVLEDINSSDYEGSDMLLESDINSSDDEEPRRRHHRGRGIGVPLLL